MSSTYDQLRLRIHEILTYAINQWGFDTSFNRCYWYTEEMGLSASTKYGSIGLTFYFGDVDLHISTDKSPTFYVRGKSFATYPIARVRPWPTPEDPNTIITDDGLILHMTVTEYEQYLERPLEELFGDRCFEWIDRLQTNGTEL